MIADGRGDVIRFVAVWPASAVSGVGSGVTGFVLGVRVYLSTGSPTRLAVVLVAVVSATPALRHIETDLPDAVRDGDADPPGGPARAGVAKGVTHAGRPV